MERNMIVYISVKMRVKGIVDHTSERRGSTRHLSSGRPTEHHAGPRVKVLIVEDDEIAAEMYRARLLADGHTVVVAGDGEEGLRMALEEDPGFILLDLRLPKLSGLGLLSRLRSTPTTRDTPVIVLTNMSDPELSYRGNALGVVEYMIKAETTPMQLSMRLAEHQRRMEAT
jgi:DNA-binding response OmpR family regulator